MKNITDDDLMLLYYGEHDDPAMAAAVAESPELTERFEALCAELSRVDDFVPPQRSEDYGAEVWRRISPQLDSGQGKYATRWNTWLSALGQPRFSWASALSLVVVASLAFMLGRQGSQPGELIPVNTGLAPATAQSGLNTERLLASSVSGHLDQLNLTLTEFANTADTAVADAGRITGLLVANRLYRQAAVTRGDHQLAAFLSELEPVLLELAHEAHNQSPTARVRMQQEIKDRLLFRIRVMNKQLDNPTIST